MGTFSLSMCLVGRGSFLVFLSFSPLVLSLSFSLLISHLCMCSAFLLSALPDHCPCCYALGLLLSLRSVLSLGVGTHIDSLGLRSCVLLMFLVALSCLWSSYSLGVSPPLIHLLHLHPLLHPFGWFSIALRSMLLLGWFLLWSFCRMSSLWTICFILEDLSLLCLLQTLPRHRWDSIYLRVLRWSAFCRCHLVWIAFVSCHRTSILHRVAYSLSVHLLFLGCERIALGWRGYLLLRLWWILLCLSPYAFLCSTFRTRVLGLG